MQKWADHIYENSWLGYANLFLGPGFPRPVIIDLSEPKSEDSGTHH